MVRAQLPILNSEMLYFISGDVVPTGMGGRRVSPVDAGGSGRRRSGGRLGGAETPLSWSALGGCCGAPIPQGWLAPGEAWAAAWAGTRRRGVGGTGRRPT